MKQRFFHSCLIVATILSGVACSEEDFLYEVSSVPSVTISFALDETRQASKRCEAQGERSEQVVDTTENLGIAVTTYEWADTPQTRGTLIDETNMTGFDVFGYQTKGSETIAIMNSEEYVASGLDWVSKSGNLYYWMGMEYTYDFFAFSPAGMLSGTELDYTVPTYIPGQKDLLVAKSEGIPGNYNSPVALDFNHICSAVKIIAEPSEQDGIITKIALRGIPNKGKYSLETNAWVVDEFSTAEFIFEPNTVLSTTGDIDMTEGNMTLLMLPQTLPPSAQMVVTVVDTQGRELTLVKQLQDFEWTMNKTHVYTISISADYVLQFDTAPLVQDAHYIICPIKVNIDDRITGKWRVESNSDWLTLRTDLTSLQQQGYWIDGDEGVASIESYQKGNGVIIYAFMKENTSMEKRYATLKLYYNNQEKHSLEVPQHCPGGDWKNGGIGWEEVEDFTASWGFVWTRQAVYQRDFGNWFISGVVYLLYSIFGGLEDYMSREGQYIKATIDYSQYSNVTGADSPTDGLTNTKNIYDFDGVSTLSQLETSLIESGYELTSSTGNYDDDVDKFAVLRAVQKNKFKKQSESSSGVTVEKAYIDSKDIVWFLPAKEQFDETDQLVQPLDGSYWSSTNSDVADDTEHAYKYVSGSGSSLELRTATHKVRAVRAPL